MVGFGEREAAPVRRWEHRRARGPRHRKGPSISTSTSARPLERSDGNERDGRLPKALIDLVIGHHPRRPLAINCATIECAEIGRPLAPESLPLEAFADGDAGCRFAAAIAYP